MWSQPLFFSRATERNSEIVCLVHLVILSTQQVWILKGAYNNLGSITTHIFQKISTDDAECNTALRSEGITGEADNILC